MDQVIDAREISLAEFNRASERIEQFQRFLDLAIDDDRVTELLPARVLLQFRAVTIEGHPVQITAFRPRDDSNASWQARITISDLEWDRARNLDDDFGFFVTADDAIDHLERRLRDALAPAAPRAAD